jgi:hypothetical protein
MAATSRARSRRWPAYELDAELNGGPNSLILKAISSVGSPQEREEPIAA